MNVLRGLAIMSLLVISMNAGLHSASADPLPITSQIKVTATVLPARCMILDQNDKILQIVSNTTEPDIELRVYRGSIKPENLVKATPEMISDAAKILENKKLKPGILYDHRNELLTVPGTDGKKNIVNIKLSGISNLRNIDHTVNFIKI